MRADDQAHYCKLVLERSLLAYKNTKTNPGKLGFFASIPLKLYAITSLEKSFILYVSNI